MNIKNEVFATKIPNDLKVHLTKVCNLLGIKKTSWLKKPFGKN